MAIELQRRDLMMMKFIYTFGAATYDQIRRKFFPGLHPATATRRINVLRRHGYLKTFWYLHEDKPQRCVKLREKAWPAIEKLWKEQIEKPSFVANPFGWAFGMNDLALRFELLKLFERMLSENIFQGSSELSTHPFYRNLVWQNCKSALELVKEEKKILFPIELEFTTKSLEHYEKKIRYYNQLGTIYGVLFLCTHNETMDVIARVDKNICGEKESCVYVALTSSVLGSPNQIVLQSVSGTKIGLY